MPFPLLAVDVSWAELSPLGWGGISCVLVLMLVVRPLSVGVATADLERTAEILPGLARTASSRRQWPPVLNP